MGVPKKKATRSRKGHRKAHQKPKSPPVSTCPQCKASKLPHFACPECGYYKGEIIATKKESK